jgi:hypothetical protein
MGRGASRESDSQLTFSQLRVRVRRSELTFLKIPCVSIQVTLSQVSRLNLGYAQCAVWHTGHSAWAMASTSFGAAGSSHYRDLEDLR